MSENRQTSQFYKPYPIQRQHFDKLPKARMYRREIQNLKVKLVLILILLIVFGGLVVAYAG